MSEFHHVSVLLDECIEGLNIKPDGIYVDGTLGGAGHSYHIAEELTTGRLIGIDRDPVALKAAGERLSPFADRVTLVHSNFCRMGQVLQELGISGVDGILLDLGVSSPQLDDGSRGFSYMTDAPLDMRMDNGDALSADTVVNTWSYEELKRILYDYGHCGGHRPQKGGISHPHDLGTGGCDSLGYAPRSPAGKAASRQADLSGHPHCGK